ncbi:SRPBCC family protein [Nonomuraea sp. SBT364]|uniref:SRPBCC family protein n=1 Tax=Nonomuraea sp. SBT364 TaxID=1580530 RepID=UPI00066C3E0C|nr:SRPBCC family protein [Nonomuraea sp. SBT364]
MNRHPTGKLFRTDAGADLVLTRSFRASAEDVWASLTESERTARWYGPWEGDATPGSTIKVQLAFEDQAPWVDMRIDACEPPRRLALSAIDESGTWLIEVHLSEADGSTLLRFVQHLDTGEKLGMIGEIGAGWEYYLDMLVAARDGSPGPDFDAYYPAMKPYYAGLAARDLP